MKKMTLVLVGVLLLLLAAPTIAADDAGRIRELDELKRTGEFNVIALVAVAIAVAVLTAIVWFLQLVIAKLLVFLIPIGTGVAAAFFVPTEAADDPDAWIIAGAFVVFGTALSLTVMIYASIHDLKGKVRDLEARAGK